VRSDAQQYPTVSEPSDPALRPPGISPGATRIVLLLVALVAVAALFWPRSQASRESGPGGMLVDPNGRPVPLSRDLRDATLVHFWATWCPPCVQELPELVRFARAEQGPDFNVVFVAVADEPEAAKRFFNAPDLTLLFDPTWDVAHRFGTDQIPESHLVVGGKVVKSFVGATAWNDPAVRRELQKWIATPPRPSP
jgi:cytochrome c biogenesis protein CcmG/thiol:disulfide interchange protein DsbE